MEKLPAGRANAVERAGFEPATLWSQTRCASQAALPLDFQDISADWARIVNYSFENAGRKESLVSCRILLSGGLRPPFTSPRFLESKEK